MSRILAVVFLCLLNIPCAYASGKTFLMVEVCLGNPKDFPIFRNMIQSFAQSEKARLIDYSARTQKDLESIGEIIPQVKPAGPVINIGFERRDGAELSVGNLGLLEHEVVVSFTEGTNAQHARQFADKVVRSLEKRWHVELVPAGTGARAMKVCEAGSPPASEPGLPKNNRNGQ